MKSKSLTPVKLRLILFGVLLLLVAVGVTAFIFGHRLIQGYALADQTSAAQAEASSSSLQDLIATKQKLNDLSHTIERADQLVSQSKLYLYQDQIITDINKYASEAGLKITNISFTAPTTAAVSGAAPTTTKPSGATPAGVKSMTATVTLETPIKYNSMLTFIHLIEQSLFRMQVSQVGLSQGDSGDGADSITSDILTIEVYVR